MAGTLRRSSEGIDTAASYCKIPLSIVAMCSVIAVPRCERADAPGHTVVNHVFDPEHWTAAMPCLSMLFRQSLPEVGQSYRGRVVKGGAH